MDVQRRRRITLDGLKRPTICRECGGVLVYRGLGEYECEECGKKEYDDYGLVREYLEAHKGANVAEISEFTGVSHKAIREMVKERRFELVESRGGYLRCEICGENIKSGRMCPKCEMEYHRQIEAEARQNRNNFKNVSVYSGEKHEGDIGRKRFERYR